MRGWFDFGTFYAAGSLTFTPQVAQLVPILDFEAQRGLNPAPFVYPAGLALLYVPFSWLPFAVSAALHVALMLALLVVAGVLGARLLGLPRNWVVLGALAWGPAAAGVVSGQNTSLALLLVAASAAAFAAERQGLGGFFAGLLAYKPQLGAPLAGLLVLRARWAGLAVLAGVLVLHYAAGVLVTGGNLAWPADWLQALSSYTAADFHDNGWQASSLPALGTRLGLVTGLPWLAAAGYVVGGAVVFLCLPALRRLPALESVALACALGLVVSPHAWVYDATMLLPGVAVFGRNASSRSWPWQDRWLLAVAFAVGLIWAFGGFVGITLMPLLVVGAPFVLLREERRQPGRRSADDGIGSLRSNSRDQ